MIKPICAEMLEALLDDVSPADLAGISSHALACQVGGWDSVSSVRFACESATFASNTRLGAMSVGMIAVTSAAPAPIMQTVTVVARMFGDEPRLVNIGHASVDTFLR